jgi:hypothetical protein
VARVGGRQLSRRGDRRRPVSRHDGQQRRARRRGRQQACHAGEHGVVVAEDPAQQRSPREGDRQRVGDTVQRLRRMLGRCDREQRVGQRAAACRPARGLGHPGRVGVDADDERVRARGSGREDVTAVTRSQVDGHPGVACDERCDLADVELEEPAT